MTKSLFELYLNLQFVPYCTVIRHIHNRCKHLYYLMTTLKALKTLKCDIAWVNLNGKCIYIFINIQVAILVVFMSLWFFNPYAMFNNTNHVIQCNVSFLYLPYQLDEMMYKLVYTYNCQV